MTDHDHEHHHEHVPVAYKDAVERFRLDKDEFFKTRPAQPDPGRRARRVHRAAVLPGRRGASTSRTGSSSRTPATSRRTSRSRPRTGKLRPAHRAGVLRFELGGEPRQLTAYTLRRRRRRVAVRAVPRRDERHRDLRRRPLPGPRARGGRHVLLDFNLAYHPSCVYDARFSCPLTPAENRLPVRVEAGERLAPS